MSKASSDAFSNNTVDHVTFTNASIADCYKSRPIAQLYNHINEFDSIVNPEAGSGVNVVMINVFSCMLAHISKDATKN